MLAVVVVLLILIAAGQGPLGSTATGRGVLPPSPVATLGGHRTTADGGAPDLLRSAPPAPGLSPAAALALQAGPVSAMAFDGADGYTIAVTANSSSSPGPTATVQTYAYSAGAWVRLTTSVAPSSRSYASLAFDPVDGYVVLFGGYSATAGYLSDTWRFSAGSWTNLTGTLMGVSPPARAGASLVFDSGTGYAVLYGGIASGGTSLTDTWSYVAKEWMLRASGSPPTTAPPALGAMAYDAKEGEVVYFGGTSSSVLGGLLGALLGGCSSATWSFASGAWTNITSSVTGSPSGRLFASASYDAGSQRILLFGGTCSTLLGTNLAAEAFNDTYAFTANGSGGSWSSVASASNHAPSPRYGAGVVLNSSSGTTLLFGGAISLVVGGTTLSTRFLADTWQYAGGNWTQIGPGLALSRSVVDTGMAVTLRVVGILGVGGVEYAYTGLPAGCLSTNASVLTCSAGSTGSFHPRVDVAIGLGLGPSGVSSASANATGTLIVNPAPSVASYHLSRNTTEVGAAVTITAGALGGTGALTYAYTGLPPGCASLNASSVSCLPALTGTFDIGVRVTDDLGVSATATEALIIVGHPSVRSLVFSLPALDLGMSTTAALLVSGGIGPFVVSYTNLPAGCSSANTTSIACSPVVTGSFSVGVHVRDALGFSADATSVLAINPDPAITSFSMTNATPIIGNSTHLRLETGGGTGPLAVSYTGLPSGCASSNTSDLACTPTETGTFHIRATVVDSLGVRATSSAILTVQTVPYRSPGGPIGPVAGEPWWLAFASGLLVGLLGIALAGTWAVLYARRNSQGRQLVRELRRAAPSLHWEPDGGTEAIVVPPIPMPPTPVPSPQVPPENPAEE